LPVIEQIITRFFTKLEIMIITIQGKFYIKVTGDTDYNSIELLISVNDPGRPQS
jgi:hypothetical protein